MNIGASGAPTIGLSLKKLPEKNEAFERACLGGKSGR
jgi:hypothetical protein